MAFICNDCSYRSTKKFPAGKCPACSSFNIKASHKIAEKAASKPKKTIVEIIVLILVWLALIYGVWDRYIKNTSPNAEHNITNDKLESEREKALPIYDDVE